MLCPSYIESSPLNQPQFDPYKPMYIYAVQSVNKATKLQRNFPIKIERYSRGATLQDTIEEEI